MTCDQCGRRWVTPLDMREFGVCDACRGGWARCVHCGPISRDEYMACDRGDCVVTKSGSGNQASQEQAVSTRRSEAP